MPELVVAPLFRPATYFRTDLMEKRAEVEIFPSKEGSKLYLRMDGVDNAGDGDTYTSSLGKMMLRVRSFQACKTARHHGVDRQSSDQMFSSLETQIKRFASDQRVPDEFFRQRVLIQKPVDNA